MKKQSSIVSDGGAGRGNQGGGRNNRRNNQKGGAANDSNAGYQARGGQGAASGKGADSQGNRAEAFELTEDQLKTRMQVLFNKFVKAEAPSGSEEDKKEEAGFQQVKDLLTSGTVKQEDGETKKLRAEDIFTHLIAKMMDMDARVIEANFKAFMEAWFESRCFEQANWKFVVRRTIVDLENYTSDLPELPKWLCSGLVCPLLRRGFISIADLQWYNEEDKDELYDVTGQFKVAALLI